MRVSERERPANFGYVSPGHSNMSCACVYLCVYVLCVYACCLRRITLKP